MEYVITAKWDIDAGVWIAESADIPGLILESGSLDALMERVRFAIPDLLALNGIEQDTFSVVFKSERHDLVYA